MDRMTPWRAVQFTDLHLYHSPEGGLLGLNTQQSFQAVLAHFKNHHWPVDVVLATGDLAQDGSVAAYKSLRALLLPLDLPVYWIPGNHDNPAAMAQALTGGLISAQRQVLLPPWQIILLDSTQPQQVSGCLTGNQLAFLTECITTHPEHYALVCLHHHPLSMGSAWLERIGLVNGADFLNLVRQYSQVRGVVWGHIHQDYTRQDGELLLMATPSTCIQFKPRTPDFALDTVLPGYRWLELHSDGRIVTGVERLTSLGPDQYINMTAQGY
ncbi:3',5'-cyclic-AMP phosphodiesterase [Candidatus Cyanaurora vandensis]|uniref:3',5'-cyclic-AMP phosphodiesterase n=1 Tax=Candidatus Cyanaurora vandensis TaxID=2714958 RepID=UPI002579E7E9|nr:3',5'-cyclic-AMP phosphodiesterase [Candidatus Cyanaurora vandensis]